MKRIIFAILLCLSFSTIYAQSERKIKKLIEDNDELIADLKSKKDALDAELNRINTEIAQIENRSFARETPDQNIKKKLAWFDDIPALVRDLNFRQKLHNTQFANTYSLIIEMYLSLQKNVGYQKDKNDFYKNQFEALKHQLSILDPAHKESFIQSFESLTTQIKDYRFTMFELVRVFDLVDEKGKNGMERAEIYSSLRADEETEFVDKIPYTKDLLREYIETDDVGRDKIRHLNAFSTIK